MSLYTDAYEAMGRLMYHFAHCERCADGQAGIDAWSEYCRTGRELTVAQRRAQRAADAAADRRIRRKRWLATP